MLGSKGPPIGNGLWRIEWSRDVHMTLKGQGQGNDPNTFSAQCIKNSWRCYLATMANYKIVCCDAVRLAILATAWLLVLGCV